MIAVHTRSDRLTSLRRVHHPFVRTLVVIHTWVGEMQVVTCPVEGCKKTSTTFDPAMYLSLPLPIAAEKSVEVSLCIFNPVSNSSSSLWLRSATFHFKPLRCPPVGRAFYVRSLTPKQFTFARADGFVRDLLRTYAHEKTRAGYKFALLLSLQEAIAAVCLEQVLRINGQNTQRKYSPSQLTAFVF